MEEIKITFKKYLDICQSCKSNGEKNDEIKRQLEESLHTKRLLYIETPDRDHRLKGDSGQAAYRAFVAYIYEKYGEDKIGKAGIPVKPIRPQNPKWKELAEGTGKYVLTDYPVFDLMEKSAKAIQKLEKNKLDQYIFVCKPLGKGENTVEETKNKTTESDPKNIILYGPPGTGKTYKTILYAVSIIEEKDISEISKEEYDKVAQRYRGYKGTDKEIGKQIEFITFHQSYGYEEFIEGIRPIMDNSGVAGGIRYNVEEGTFVKFCREAEKYKEKKYVFIIDEINRGNISKIFGELIALIEESKRLRSKEETKVKLPYSKKMFGVPDNVYILGTMNTADRSIAVLDTALRRRFHFVEVLPEPALLTEVIIDGLNIGKMLEKINRRISVLYDREHTIGHAYFMPLKEDPSLKRLGRIFKDSIIPLLQEYFFDDYEKMILILGDNNEAKENKFWKPKETVKDLFGDAGWDDLNEEYKLNKEYELNEGAFMNISSYKEI